MTAIKHGGDISWHTKRLHEIPHVLVFGTLKLLVDQPVNFLMPANYLPAGNRELVLLSNAEFLYVEEPHNSQAEPEKHTVLFMQGQWMMFYPISQVLSIFGETVKVYLAFIFPA